MLPLERHKIILDLLSKNKIVKVGELVEIFDVSTETIRRDLEELEASNKLERIYGGAVPIITSSEEPAYNVRAISNPGHKECIGKLAAEFIEDRDTIILDIGTTCLEIAKNIKNKNITVLTTSLPITNELANTNVRLYCLGGLVRPNELSMSGGITEYVLNQFHVDKAFIGAGGISLNDGISDYNIEEAQIRRQCMTRAQKVFLVSDYSKFGINSFAHVASLDAVDTLITDWDANEDILNKIKKLNIDVVVAKKPE